MKDKFINWLKEKEDKSPSTARSYAGAIHKISEHLSNIYLNNVDLYSTDDIAILSRYVSLYDLNGKYSDIGDKGKGTYRNALKALIRFHKGSPKVRTYKNKYTKNQSVNYSDYNFDETIMSEATEMSKYYSFIYSLEVSLRNLVNKTLSTAFGVDWWETMISANIKSNVQKKIDTENNRVYSKKSVHPLSYTTFRELRLIVEQNWDLFSNELKNERDFIKITEDLNIIRNNVAHSIMLPDDEKLRLKLALKDWFRLKK